MFPYNILLNIKSGITPVKSRDSATLFLFNCRRWDRNCNIFFVIIFTNLNAVFCSFYTNGLLFLLENIAANTRKSMNKTAAYTNTITLCSSPASSAMRNYMNTDIPSWSAIIMEVKKCQKYAKITAKILIIYVMIIT